jgi:hypothetical protein
LSERAQTRSLFFRFDTRIPNPAFSSSKSADRPWLYPGDNFSTSSMMKPTLQNKMAKAWWSIFTSMAERITALPLREMHRLELKSIP